MPELQYGVFVEIDPKNYPIDNQKFLDSFPTTTRNYIEKQLYVSISPTGTKWYSEDAIYFAAEARKITENLSLVTVTEEFNPHGPTGVVLFDETDRVMIERVNYSFYDLDKWISSSVRISVQSKLHSPDQIVLHDYANQKSVVLYEEPDPDVQLADVCEYIGCVGILYKTVDENIVFGRHQMIDGTTATVFLETVSVPLPDEYLPTWHDEYMNGV